MTQLRNRSSSPPRNERRFSDEEIAQMVARRNSGMRWIQVGAPWGLSPQAAKRQVDRWATPSLTEAAQQAFDRLDALSRERALTETESIDLEEAIKQIDRHAPRQVAV